MGAGTVEEQTWSCPIDRAMGVVGSRCAMLLMREASYGTTRFDDFVARVDVAPATASAHLRALVDAGLLEREQYREPGARTRAQYRMTPAGRDLVPVLLALFRWGEQHTDARPAVQLVHAGCGAPARLVVECAAGHRTTEDEVAVTLRG